MIDAPTTAARSLGRSGIGRPGRPGRKPAQRDGRRAFWRDVLATDFLDPPRHGWTWHRQRVLTVVLAMVLIAVWRSVGG